MTYATLSRIGLLAAASLVMTLPALAGDDFGRGGPRHNHSHNSGYQGGSWAPGLPSVLPGIGTYSGNIAAARIRGNGIYFAIGGTGHASYARATSPVPQAPAAKITHVNAATAKSACAWEAGVCVIRP